MVCYSKSFLDESDNVLKILFEYCHHCYVINSIHDIRKKKREISDNSKIQNIIT